jgi:hypothetical protein
MPFLIDGFDYPYKPFAQPTIEPAIHWFRNSAGRMDGRDFGAGQDKFLCEMTFENTPEAIDDLVATLITAGTGTVILSGITEGMAPFGPLVDYEQEIEAVIDRVSERKFPTLGRMSTVSARIRAVAPALLSVTPSLATLRLQPNYEANDNLDLPTAFTYSQAAHRLDRGVSSGRFTGRFVQTTVEARAVLAYLLVTARANVITFPALDVTYPFGQAGAGSDGCKITKWSLRRLNLSMWEFRITFDQDLEP